MASKTIILDDLDGKTEGAETTRITIRIGVDEHAVDIDLAKPNQDKLMTTLKPYFDAGREVTRKSGSDSETTKARAWLQQHGHKVGEKGRIPDDLMAIYRANAGSLQVRLWALGLRGAKPFRLRAGRYRNIQWRSLPSTCTLRSTTLEARGAMKFTVYTRKNDHLVPLYKIRRTPAGLYFNNVSGGGPSYTTYHEDGAYWGRVGHTKTVKKRREPLSSLTGPYTLSTMTGTILAPMPHDRKAADVQLRAEDIVVDLPNPFGAEIIISGQEVTLEPLPERVDSQVFVKSNLAPILTFEFFGNPTNALQVGRFPSPPIYKMTFEANERI